MMKIIMMMMKMIVMMMMCFIGDFRNFVDVNFCCVMGFFGGGRNFIIVRFQRYFNLFVFIEMEDFSKKKIFGIILKFWMRMFDYSYFRIVE